MKNIDFEGLNNLLKGLSELRLWSPLFMFTASFLFAAHYFPLFFNFNETFFNYMRTSCSLLLLLSFAFLFNRMLMVLKRKYEWNKFHKKISDELNNLNDDEMNILKSAVKCNSRTIIAHAYNPMFLSLRHKRILDYVEGATFHENNAPFVIDEFIWKKIKNDPRFSG